MSKPAEGRGNREGYPVEWRGEVLYLSDLTDGVKAAFCAEVYRVMLESARQRMPAAAYFRFEDRLTARPPQWTTLPDECVADALDVSGPYGERFHLSLNRLLFGLAGHEMADAELRELIDAKGADPAGDYARGMKQVRENSDPKVPTAGGGSPAPTAGSGPTPPSATSPSA